MKNNKRKIGKYKYPKFSKIRKYFFNLDKDKKINWKNIKIIACQHLLEPQKEMFKGFLECGIKPSNIFVLGKIYSTNFEILKELQDLGINAFQPKFNQAISFDIQHKDSCKRIFSMVVGKKNDKLIILDDGAQMLNIANNAKSINTVGVEQTSSGFRKLENVKLKFPIYNVARSRMKLEEETPFIVSLGYERVEEKIAEWKLIKPNILVVGLGPIGKAMTDILKLNKRKVFRYDKIDGEKDISNIIISKKIDIVIGATGAQIISHDEIIKLNSSLNHGVYFVSMSSSDREFEMWKLRDIFNNFKTTHTDVIYKNILITNNGFPITFKGNRYESKPEEIEKTICLLFSGVLLGITENNIKKGLIDIPQNIVDIIGS